MGQKMTRSSLKRCIKQYTKQNQQAQQAIEMTPRRMPLNDVHRKNPIQVRQSEEPHNGSQTHNNQIKK